MQYKNNVFIQTFFFFLSFFFFFFIFFFLTIGTFSTASRTAPPGTAHAPHARPPPEFSSSLEPKARFAGRERSAPRRVPKYCFNFGKQKKKKRGGGETGRGKIRQSLHNWGRRGGPAGGTGFGARDGLTILAINKAKT